MGILALEVVVHKLEGDRDSTGQWKLGPLGCVDWVHNEKH